MGSMGNSQNGKDVSSIMNRYLPFWDKLSDSEKELVTENLISETFAKGMMINRTDKGCRGAMLLMEGQIRVYMVSEEGREVTLYRLHAGDTCVLSASCLLDSIEFDVVIEAVSEAKVLLIPSTILHQIMEKNPYVELYLAKSANERFSDVMWTMQQILFMGADKRVAIFLWDEMQKVKSQNLKFTHDEIAKLIGSAREVVSRILKYFEAEGILKLSRGKIEIVDKEKLKTYL